MQGLPRMMTSRWRAPVLVTTALLVAGLFPLANVALAAVTVTAATGGEAISADTRSPSASPPGNGTWTSLTGPVLAEGANTDLADGTIVLTLPTGFEFNTGVGSVTASGTGCTASAITYSATTASTTIATTTNLCTFTYSGLQVRPTTNGAALSSGNIAGSGTAGPPNVNYGTLTEVAGAATKLTFTTQPGGGTGGIAWATQPVVTVQDQFGNTVTTSTAPVALAIGTNPSGGTLTCTTNPLAASAGVASFTGCKIDKAGTGYTLTASSAGLTGATSTTFNITVGPAAQLAFSAYPASPTVTTLTPQPAVTVQDAGGNTVTSDNATSITLAIGTNPAAGTLACTGGLSKTVTAGVASFAGCTINNPGTGYTLTADDGAGGLALITGAAFNVVAGPATKLAFTTQPGGGIEDTPWATQPVVTVQDQFGNTVTTDSSTVVTLAITSPVVGGGSLSCTGGLSKTVTAGVASFTGCKLDAPVVGYRLTATSVPVLTPATSDAFDVALRPADRLGFLAQPSAAAVGVPFSVQPVVAVQDAVGGTIRSGSWATAMITLSLGSNPGGGTLTCTGGNSKAAVAGVATFAGCTIDKTGTGYTLVASVAGLTSATSAPFEVTTPAAQVALFSSASTITWGAGVNLSVFVSPNGANRSVVLESSPDGVSWATIATLTTDAAGNASYPYRPATNLYYRVNFAGAPDLQAGLSNTVRVVVRQIALLRPTNKGAIKSIARNTSIMFTTTVRPARPELSPARVTFRLFRFSAGAWRLVTSRDVTTDSLGKASTTFTFSSPGSWYVRSIANPTPYNANSVWSPLERYSVR